VVSNNDSSGIVIRGSNGTGDGGNSVDLTISTNNIQNNGRRKQNPLAGDGIVVVGGDTGDNVIQALISDNVIHGSDGEGIRVTGAGTGSSGSNNSIDATITGNRIQNNGVGDGGSGNGITITGGPTLTVPATTSGNIITFVADDNVSSNNRDNGIGVGGNNGSNHVVSGTISNNTFNSNDLSGILLIGRGSTNTLQDIDIQFNTVTNNLQGGLVIFGGDSFNTVNATISNVLVDGNTFVGNNLDGVSATRGSGAGNVISIAGITNNFMSRNDGDGLIIRAGINGTGATPITGNDADKNGDDGFDIGATGYFLSLNNADKNTDAGISAVGNTNGGGNTATGNQSCNTPGCY
jgi:hypothetical protein